MPIYSLQRSSNPFDRPAAIPCFLFEKKSQPNFIDLMNANVRESELIFKLPGIFTIKPTI